jgi:hypothetical protein
VRALQQWRSGGLEAFVRISTSVWFVYWLFILVYTAVHLASWANVRYRLPVDAFLILFAAYGIDHLVTRCQCLRTKTASVATPSRYSQGDQLGVQ